jgi:hypothetical protein
LWQYGLYGDFSEAGYVDAPQNDKARTSSIDLDRQWLYHAVASSILAHNILLTDSRVIINKIGIAGISWGGVITSLAIGYDNRYAFAIPIYGSGYLDQALSYMESAFGIAGTKKLWSAADRFGNVHFPVLWMCWTNDQAFSINSNSLSYDATKAAGAVFCAKMNWNHGHSAGFNPPEIFRFADSVCMGGGALTSCVTEPSGRSFSFTIKTPGDATGVTAKAYYLTQKLSYSQKGSDTTATIDQKWESINCTVNGNTVTGALPADAVQYYVEITAKTASGSFDATTRFVEING